MNVEEKKEIVRRYCATTTCSGCKFTKDGNCTIRIITASESELDNAINIINGVNEDVVNCPKHYTDGKIEVIEFIEDKKLGFCLGNAVKYIARAGKKDPTKEVEDLKKARWYIERRIKELTEGIV